MNWMSVSPFSACLSQAPNQAASHYLLIHYDVPYFDVDSFRLSVTGLVEKEGGGFSRDPGCFGLLRHFGRGDPSNISLRTLGVSIQVCW